MEHELVTIAISHYCEKARWALERFSVPYREEKRMPVFHLPAVWWRTRGGKVGKADPASSPLSTPLLVTKDGEVLTDSADIVAWVDRHHAGGALYPSEEVAALEKRLGEKLGPHTRRLAYFLLFDRPALLDTIAERNVSRGQALAFKAVSGLALGQVKARLKVSAEGAARSEARISEVTDEIAARLADGRPFLVGDQFTAADLAFACMMAPAVLPPEFGAWLPEPAALPERGRAKVEAMREHPAGRFALRMFAEERHRRVDRGGVDPGARA